MYLHRIPPFVQQLYPDYIWRLPSDEKVVYFTFDDGPTPEISTWVLQQLAAYKARATFFLVGQQVRRCPELAHRMIDAGHRIGNHSESHRNGRKIRLFPYLRDVLRGRQTIAEYTGIHTHLYRPPYGRLTLEQSRQIQRSHRIVMMDVISGDFDLRLKGDDCLQQVIRHVQPGSIVLWHDSQKAWDRLRIALPAALAYFHAEGYRFAALPLDQMLPKVAEEVQ
ncbi:MAG: polysaccharide deacetylase family protein [Bacteroidia bacterium]